MIYILKVTSYQFFAPYYDAKHNKNVIILKNKTS